MLKNKSLQSTQVIDLFNSMLKEIVNRRVKFLLFSSLRPQKCSGYFVRLKQNKEDKKYHIVFKHVKKGNTYLKYWLVPLNFIRFIDLKNYSTFIDNNEILKAFFDRHLEKKTKIKTITKFNFM